MKQRFINPGLKTRIFATGLALLVGRLEAAPFRVTTWDLQPSATLGTNGWSAPIQQHLIQEAAETLRKINPDVIILQHVANWQMCDQLTKALAAGNYNLTVCSFFKDARDKTPMRSQVAILAKGKAYQSWFEPWQSSGQIAAAPGGFAFAAIRVGDKNIGFFSADLDNDASNAEESRSATQQQAREESAKQLLQQIASLENWTANKLQVFVIAGDFNTTVDDPKLAGEKTLSRLEQAGFDNAMAGLPLSKRVTLPASGRSAASTMDYIFTRDGGAVTQPVIVSGTLMAHSSVTCDIDPAAPKNLALMAVAETPVVAPVVEAKNPALPWILTGFLGGIIALFVVMRWMTRRTQASEAVTALLELKAKTSASVAIPNAERVMLTQTSESTSNLTISPNLTQTHSETAQTRAGGGNESGKARDDARSGVIAEMSRWLKTKVMQRLVAERAQLIATQQVAALKVLAVDERLGKIERQIQLRNQEYEQRIDELLKELVEAKEENRELIRAKIAHLKAEIEKSKAKMAEESQQQQSQN